MKLSLRCILESIACVAIAGYPFLASTTALMGVGNTLPSLIMRTILIVLCLIPLLRLRKPAKPSWGDTITALYLSFWLIYFLRLYHSTLLDGERLPRPDSYYWIWAVGACFVPFLAISTRSLELNFRRMFVCIYMLTAAACIFASSQASTTVLRNGIEMTRDRVQLEALNPISLGHLGATAVLLALYQIFILPSTRRRLIWLSSSIFLISFGAYLIFMSGSRGPLLALIIGMLVLIITQPVKKMIKISFSFLTMTVLILPRLLEIANNTSISSLYRFRAALTGEDDGSQGRLSSYESALEVFSNSAFIGGGLVEPQTQTYPHNFILEALMSTGIVGGIPLILAATACLVLSILLPLRDKAMAWLGLLHIQAFVGAMFTGAVYNITLYWTTAALIASVMSVEHVRKNGFKLLRVAQSE